MELTHEFTVPTSPEETWTHFQDVAALAECFPGAQVSETDGDTFRGSCKVKLGPIALVYQGSGTFVERDEAERRFVVEAKGKDKRGNGTATATVTLAMAPADAGSGTAVQVITDLTITGKPAQFGRGVMQDVSDKLLGQFVACLEERLGAAGPTPVAEPVETPAAGPVETPAAGSVETPAAGTAGAPAAPRTPSSRPGAPGEDALDLGATALPVLWRAYGKQVLGVVAGLAGLLALRRLVRRRH